MHSGRQFGGAPIIPVEHEHASCPWISRQIELGPQGDGVHGFFFSTSTGLWAIPRHLMKGSPVVADGQLQIAEWLMTWHLALTPQVPRHGSSHFCWMQARFVEQSLFRIHSGLQEGGVPIYWGKQEQAAWLKVARHCENGPHGEGLQGFLFSSWITFLKKKTQYLKY